MAILLPLSGARADIGQAMLHAAQLALDGAGAPPLDAKDTGGTPDGAAAAAQAAIAEGAGLILGPLTSPETAAVAPIARAANVAVLAFTNDPSQAQPGVWTLGITPGQQVRRLVAAAQAQGKSQFAALLPDTDFGRAMGQALTQATTAAAPRRPTYGSMRAGMSAINARRAICPATPADADRSTRRSRRLAPRGDAGRPPAGAGAGPESASRRPASMRCCWPTPARR